MRKNLLFFIVTAFFSTGVLTRLEAQTQQQVRDSIRFLIENYRFAEAAAYADIILQKGNPNPEIMLYKGRALAAGSDFRGAASVFLEAYGADTSNIVVVQELLTNYANAGDQEKAVFYAEKAVRLKPQNSFFRLQLSNLYLSDKAYQKALHTLEPLLYYETPNAAVLKQLGAVYFESGNYDTARFFYQQSMKLTPDDSRTCQKLINVFLKQKDYNGGLAAAGNYLLSDSLNTNILRLKAYCYYLLKDYTNAESIFRKCIILGDESKFVLKYIGMSLYMQEDYFESGRYFQKTFALDNTDPEIAYYIGVTSYKTDSTKRGVFYLQKALELEKPTTDFLSSVYAELAAAYTQNQQPDTAIGLLLKANSISPGKKSTLFRIAYQYDKYLVDKQKALQYYRAYLNSDPENGDVPISSTNKMSFRQFAETRISEIKKSP